jgi:GNAT superfamily N-acetyltransferase
VRVRPLVEADRAAAAAWIRERWGDDVMAGHGELFRPSEHDGFVAGDWVGLVTYRIAGAACEITLIDADPAGRGTGSALLAAVIDAARTAGAVRVWLITTNDNLDAIAWYEHKGFAVSEVRPGAVDEARAMLKPSIPPRNASNGLAISDEIELTLAL